MFVPVKIKHLVKAVVKIMLFNKILEFVGLQAGQCVVHQKHWDLWSTHGFPPTGDAPVEAETNEY